MSKRIVWAFLIVCGMALYASQAAISQSFRVQCPTSTITHPNAANNNSEPAFTGPTAMTLGAGGFLTPTANVNGAIKCQQISGGDGFATMADGTQTFMFSFGPLSGLADIAAGQPGSEYPNVFNTVFPGTFQPGDPATTDGAAPTTLGNFSYNGAVGLAPDLDAQNDNGCKAPCLDGHVDPRQIMDVGVMNGNIPAPL